MHLDFTAVITRIPEIEQHWDKILADLSSRPTTETFKDFDKLTYNLCLWYRKRHQNSIIPSLPDLILEFSDLLNLEVPDSTPQADAIRGVLFSRILYWVYLSGGDFILTTLRLTPIIPGTIA